MKVQHHKGEWRITSEKPEALKQVGAQYFRGLLKELANGPHRGAIIEKLRDMGVTHASALQPNQLGTFNNFLQKLKAK